MKPGKTMMGLREERGISRKQVAGELGIKPGSLWRIEMDKVMPRQSTIEKFCAVMKLPLAYFYSHAFTLTDFLPPSE